jgi:DNA-binding transcriptional LysR family regulator
LLIDKNLRRIDAIDARPMNIHHLELFYHVAKHGGISRAARKMPYGVQQPAISAQILRLEEELDAILFQRRPFRLTKSGDQLFRFIEPFFSQLDEVAAQLRGESGQRLRLAASGPVLRHHFPALLAAHRAKHPGLRLALRETNQLEAETLLQENEIDLAITELEGKPPVGIKSCVVLALPLALLVPSDSPWRSAEQFLREDHPDEALISLPPEEALTRLFQKGFAARGRRFAIGVEVSSLESMRTYVARGFGIGLSVASPSATDAPEIRSLAITKFPKLILGALWIGKLPALAQSFLTEVRRRAAELEK